MATWKKVIVSGSDAELNTLQVGGGSGGTGVTVSTVGAVTADAAITAGSSFIIGSADMNETDLEKLDGITNGTAAASKAVVLDGSKNIATIGTIGSGAITSTGASTFGSISNASTVAASKMSGSFTGSFTGDGSNLTGVAQDIELLNAYGAATLHQTQDKFLVSDNGTEKSITFSNLEDSIFANVSGDIAIAAGGAATVTGATTNAALTAGAGISAGGTFDGATARTFALDINELTAEAIASGDTIAFNDSGDNGQHKETIDDIATLFAGTGLTATNAVLAVDAAQTQITSVGTIGTGTWEGTTVAVDQGGTGATTLSNLITLGTHSTGNYVATIADSGGGGITVANSGAESAAVTLELDINGLTTDSIASGDFIAFSDEGEAGDPANKDTIDDVATLFAGTGLTAASAVIGVDASQTQITSVGALDAGSITSNFGSINNGASAITTTGTVSAATLSVSGNATVDGNLDVNGTVTTIQSANLLVKDRFILMNSGSAAGDGGIIVQTEGTASGSAFVYDDTGTRWGFQQGTKLAQDASTSIPDAYASAVVTSDDANYRKNGNIRVESDEIYIYIE